MPKILIDEFKALIEADFRILRQIEVGIEAKRFLPLEELESATHLSPGFFERRINYLSKLGMVDLKREFHESYIRLSYDGMDALALNDLRQDDTITSIGGLIGVGKESDVYSGFSKKTNSTVAIKFHRLGKANFRRAKKKRLYIAQQQRLTRFQQAVLSAAIESKTLKLLSKNQRKVPQLIGYNRHIVVMEFCPGTELYKITHNSPDFYQTLWDSIKREIDELSKLGIIHGDLSPYNILVTDEGNFWIIDWPQTLQITTTGAKEIFERDMQTLYHFFSARIDISKADFPTMPSTDKLNSQK